MDQSELLSLLISLSSLVVVVAVLIGLFTAITKFTVKYGMFIVLIGLMYLLFKGSGVDVSWFTDVVSTVGTELTQFNWER